MQKQVTIHDIAKLVNASAATVSRVLSNSSYPVSQELSEKIKLAAKQLNYTPNMLGRQLKTRNSMTIGVIIPSISNPFYADIVLGIEEVARKYDHQVFLCNSHQNPQLETEYLQNLLEKQVKGLIISSISNQQDLLGDYLAKGMRVISIDQAIDIPDIYQIGFDYRKGGYIACKHLIDNGHRKIAFLSAPLDRPSRRGVFQGYQEALQEAGIEPESSWLQIHQFVKGERLGSAVEFTNGRMLARNIIHMADRPTAIITCNDLTAIGAMNELMTYGVKVPDEISVIGFDNIEISQMVTPLLTTIDHPKYEMGQMACSMLMDVLQGIPVHVKEQILQPRLIDRSSVKKRVDF
ncbi:LacI family DNA-binding transcriptional regulator [Paenibacillus thalictri]|uniref:LacI family transcriptional regulator n=1 Tax=Paenibacillus thalictri TaxID=2527873 RepID=A0A4Q9DN39_9BACL|nr:LacI family DNA-binding transcriptional regulator [Paenibacillus thalictri]TBL77350.1 LacI family transcriptional regulator [Paenibacillus thalictri]